MKLSRTKEYNFGWLIVLSLIDVVSCCFLFPAQLEFYFAAGISVSLPFRVLRRPADRPANHQHHGRRCAAIYFRDQRTTLEQLGPLLDEAKREGRSIIIRADRLTPYELVVAVTNAALDTASLRSH